MILSRESRSTSNEVDIVALTAAVLIVVGWFGMSTLVTEFAGVQLRFHFYDMWSVVANPPRLLTGLAGGDSVRGFAFGVICIAAALAVLAPQRLQRRSAWLAYLIPLALMIVCGAVLYERTSGEYFADTGAHGAIGSELVALANRIVDHMSVTIAEHISIGLGAYVSFIASVFLAARGLARFRAR